MTTKNTDRAHRGVPAAQGFALVRSIFGLVYLSNAIAKLTQASDVRLDTLSGTLITRDGVLKRTAF